MDSQTRVQKEELFLEQADIRHQQVADSELLHKMIATRAYHISERRDFEPGYEDEDWLQAEHEQVRALTFSRVSKAGLK